ncbi:MULTISPECIES: LysR family transcriptional regulator [Catenuloplanes]|uniref:DNA-binding transcriptional LysR family regulator n=1 Tax=Catenuloplanes niger TaxID=587534 RepID=A0AAE4CVX8_9ACTN|nr:LysR family transcriptional regulator [Catenuloplanes niger]MDR7327911.1 DNA-binding transcriptional LysR family regulator [Catenuloplanes niger]
METRRLRFLVELARLGSMRAVADVLGTSTSTVSQQVAALAREVGAPLVEPDGRNVRLTAAGRRLAGHADGILAAVEAARLDLDPGAVPVGTVRVAGFETAIRRSVLPVAGVLAVDHPGVRLTVLELEPDEALGLLAVDGCDLVLAYDFDLAPASFGSSLRVVPVWSRRWGLGVPASSVVGAGAGAVEVFRVFAGDEWIVNSRNGIDERVVRTVASMAGFRPRVTHRADSLELMQDLIAAGLGVSLLPVDVRVRPGVRVVPLAGPEVVMRACAVTRAGREVWAPLAVVLGLLAGCGEPDDERAVVGDGYVGGVDADDLS